jgi:DNA helicase-2/ATP-dependent DNA helicase PcrA
MAKAKRNVTVVGDDAQAIYSFRGASFENILGFPERYPTPRRSGSPATTVDAGDPRARERDHRQETSASSRRSWSASRESGAMPAVVALADIPGPGELRRQRILEWHDEGERALRRRRPLPRALPGARAADRADAARHPYEIRSGTRFFEQRHVKDVLAFLRSSSTRRTSSRGSAR